MKVLNTVLTIIGYGFDAASLTSGPLYDLGQLLGRQHQEPQRPSGQGDALLGGPQEELGTRAATPACRSRDFPAG
jgi:hypothetical protein